ncbi:MAG: DNA-directed RNA polymerase subunit B [Thermoprotei archaeon]|nr:MAG: DNA-directed RNA polymerase subunit B [Thermoprotei archaeon]RLF25413.1 MAG: DNA-directed RNA polymerase subunit B [Thermoprotei archaeon]
MNLNSSNSNIVRCDITDEDRWYLVEVFIKEHGLARQHLDSYNDFIERRLQEIVDEYGVIETDIPGYYIKLGKIRIGSPRIREADGSETDILPMEARLRNLTYAAPMYLTMIPVINDEEQEPVEVYIGQMPIMVKSIKCPLSRMSEEELIAIGEDPRDPGGYFIINGSERVLVAQEDLAVNRVLVDIGGASSSVTHTAKVFSATSSLRVPVTLERLKDGTLHVSFPSVPERIPLGIMMKALGLETEKQIVEAITDDPEIAQELWPTLLQTAEIKTTEEALDYIGSRVAIAQTREYRIQRAEQIIDKYFLPHLGTTPEARKAKAYFLGQMAEKLIELVLGRRKPDDKDHYANKRLKLAGDLLAQLFRVAFKQFCNDVRYQLERLKSRNRPINVVTIVRADVITERLRHALATGNWVGGRAGVSQLLDRTNYLSTLSHLRRVVSPLSRSQPHFEARELHPTQWGRLCPNESPEGQNCGLVKNLALTARITIGIDEKHIEELLLDKFKVIPIDVARSEGIKGAKIFLNGRLIGIHQEPEKLVNEIRRMRRQGMISYEVNIAHYKDKYINEVYVNCDAGRVQRPLIVVENGEVKLKREHIEKLKRGEWTWYDLIKRGMIEYLDAEEEENALIAVYPGEITPEHTHLELAPAAILGVVASIIPYAEHNQSPRNSYEAAMGKQALGLPFANFKFRMDSRMHLLHYPQIPLVQTKGLQLIGYNERPSGQNMIVAVATWGGYNIQDAIIMNKASIERGLARSTFFRTYEAEERRYPGGQVDEIRVPDPSVRGYRTTEAYAHLGEDGIVEPETFVSGGEVLIGRVSPPRFLEEYRAIETAGTMKRDTSVSLRHGEKGIVDLVMITENADGNKLVKVRVRDLRIPELGDKFASRHGQKGVIGMIVPQEDLPFNEEGIVPDLIINPHAFPSRMTLGQLIETIAGKVAALAGRFVDGTPFSGEKEDKLRIELIKLGYRGDGKEALYDGITGELLETPILIGIVYYQKLHHMVADKIHARARGPVQILTRQPTEGRAREGGLRFGEMERDCLIGHGASMLLRERLFEQSDRYVVYVCEKCGMIGYYDRKKDRYVCPLCGDKGKLWPVEMSYAFKLLLQELMSMCIFPRIRLVDKASAGG